jgi:hypothetical protein
MADLDDDLKRQIDDVLNSGNRMLKACQRFLEVILPTVDAICNHVEIQSPNRMLVYRCITRRVYENLGMIVSSVSSDYPYMSVMPLRPLCEDLIYGAWLQTLPEDDADRLVDLSTLDDIFKSIAAQNKFLPKAYDELGRLLDEEMPLFRLPGLTPVETSTGGSSDAQGLVYKQKLKTLGLKLGWPKGRMPSIYEMAKQSGLSETYEFFYHGSSKAVHANLHNMGRMVWGNPQSGAFTITSQNFEDYYRLFSLTYGIWLADETIHRITAVEFPEEFELIDETAYSIWLAMVIGGLARNGALPPLVTTEELRRPWKTT